MRPKTTTAVARRLIGQALGVAAAVSDTAAPCVHSVVMTHNLPVPAAACRAARLSVLLPPLTIADVEFFLLISDVHHPPRCAAPRALSQLYQHPHTTRQRTTQVRCPKAEAELADARRQKRETRQTRQREQAAAWGDED